MGRESSDNQTVVQYSSIALLQERFRQLERAKEMRGRREILRMLSDSDRCTTTTHNDLSSSSSSKLLFNSELMLPSRRPAVPPSQLSLSLCPNSPSHLLSDIHHPNFQAAVVSPSYLAKSRVNTDTRLDHPSFIRYTNDNIDTDVDVDVDTSLHLQRHEVILKNFRCYGTKISLFESLTDIDEMIVSIGIMVYHMHVVTKGVQDIKFYISLS